MHPFAEDKQGAGRAAIFKPVVIRSIYLDQFTIALSRRQVHRLLKTFQADGPAAIRHKARGRASNNRIDPAIRDFAVTLVRETYIDFGPTLAAEKLEEDHGLKVSRETLRKWMQDAGIWLSRKHRRTFHQPRLRRESKHIGGRHSRHPALAHLAQYFYAVQFALAHDHQSHRHTPILLDQQGSVTLLLCKCGTF
jgi:hypothetical protein